MSQPTILILGSTGQVGYELLRRDWPGFEVRGLSRPEIDLTQPYTLTEPIHALKPTILINAAADTAVDRAESETEAARLANSVAPEVMAIACSQVGSRLIHFSTDYVFNGLGNRPYQESDPVGPVNTYGLLKLEGEQAVLADSDRHLVFRLSWVYSTRGRNFALTMLRLAREGKPIRVVADQVGSPSYAKSIAHSVQAAVFKLNENHDEGGLFHLTANGSTSWHGFASTLLEKALGEETPEVAPIPTSAFPTPAKRPAYSVLDNSHFEKRFGITVPTWEAQLERWALDLNSFGSA